MKTSYNRSVACLLAFAAVGLGVLLWPAPGRGQDAPADAQDEWARYAIILERNIFSRQRGPRQVERADTQPDRPVVVPNPESYFVLKGVVQEDGAFIAFLEDSRRNEILRVRAGDAVARGTIRSLSLDAIEYQFEDRTISVNLGQDLEGGRGAVTMGELMQWSETPSSTTAPPSTGAAPTATPAPTGDEAEILRRLLERRNQQLGQ